MYKISVPVMNDNINERNRDAYLAEIRRFDAQRVFLAIGTYPRDAKKREVVMARLKENCRFFKENGIEVGVWFWTFNVGKSSEYTKMMTIDGSEISSFACPTDERFVDFAADWVSEVAGSGVDMIMFDDDFRYGFQGDQPGCLCENHIAEINKITGEEKTREELFGYITSGGRNKFRDAYLRANGDAFRRFARRMRAAVDSVDPSIRLGACACMTAWDIDGVNARELSYILAGNTKPFLRLIGAPYWAAKRAWGTALGDVIETERMESAWTRDGNIEIMAEGDTYPRPRSLCPASYLEGFDIAMRASGCVDGILKYGIDYYSNIGYESEYAAFHERNRDIYKEVDDIFGGKEAVGVRIYESSEKLADTVMPTAVNDKISIQDMFFSKAGRTTSYNAIPTVYEGDGVCGMVFDENARNLPLSALKKGLILDIAAAEILTCRGVDVGIELFGENVRIFTERFICDGNAISSDQATVNDITLKEGTKILSEASASGKSIPVSYRYENENGERFLVLNINTRGSENLLKHYARGRQMADEVKWLSGETLPAYSYGHPALYIQAKRGGDSSLAVGLWNLHPDAIYKAEIELSAAYSSARFVNCTGRLDSDRVYIDCIHAFEFAAVELKK
ncbi:MAG: hypothetical protein E7611_08940 [Ruminococcaceae bacterium]|nr:hypothetical protein [Oscillospiraceae bacterium]